MSECPFLDIADLVRDKVLSYLPPYGLLKLREVCTTTLTWINESPKDFKKWKNVEIRIEETGFKSFNSLLQTKFPISRIYISNESINFYNNPLIPEFLREYGRHVTHLKIRKFFTCESTKETYFVKGFPNLQTLELEFIDAGSRAKRFNINSHTKSKFPPNFKNLKVLKLGEVSLIPPTRPTRKCVPQIPPAKPCSWYLWDLIEFCSNLEFLKHPKILPAMPDDNSNIQFQFIEGFSCVAQYVEFRGEGINPLGDNLKYYDTQNISHGVYPEEIVYFKDQLRTFQAHGTKLLNVNAKLFGNLSSASHVLFGRQITCDSVISLRNLTPGVLYHDYINLEKISIKTSESFISSGWEWMDWPVLKSMDVDFDFENSDTDGRGFFYDFVDNLMGVKRPTVEDLVMKFHSNDPGAMGRPVISPKIISAPGIIGNFPNLKKLKIIGWDKKNEDYARVWEGLRDLEEVWIENCNTLGNDGFIGRNQKEPSFLKLTKLKKLTLAKLDFMPEITDRVFQHVFSHMNLKEFCLMSDSPVENITADAISFLLEGEFRKTNTKFPFNSWSSSKIYPEVFKELGNKFRLIG